MTKPCKHEYVFIFQRRLKDLDRRLVRTRAYLPTGFTENDFNHLGLQSYCFCSKCRIRLHSKKSTKKSKLLIQQNLELVQQINEIGQNSELLFDHNEKSDLPMITSNLLSDIILDEYSDLDINLGSIAEEE